MNRTLHIATLKFNIKVIKVKSLIFRGGKNIFQFEMASVLPHVSSRWG